MKTLIKLIAPLLLIGILGCESNTTTNTTIKKETKIDSDGNEKTTIKTQTEQTTINNNDPDRHETRIEVKHDDPVIKLGPLEVHK